LGKYRVLVVKVVVAVIVVKVVVVVKVVKVKRAAKFNLYNPSNLYNRFTLGIFSPFQNLETANWKLPTFLCNHHLVNQ
jgi:hypothetical protein